MMFSSYIFCPSFQALKPRLNPEYATRERNRPLGNLSEIKNFRRAFCNDKKNNCPGFCCCSGFVGCLTLIMHFLKLQILVYYGLFLLILYSANAIVFGLIKKNVEWFGIMAQALLILSSFICIIFLGGITNSIGIVFVGLVAVVFSVIFQKVRIALSLAVLYSLTIIVAGILLPLSKMKSNSEEVHLKYSES